jgi:DNA polymerase-1
MGAQDERAIEGAAGHTNLAIPPAWAERLEQSRRNRPPPAEAVRVVPLSADYFGGRLNLVEGADDALRLVELARQRPLAYCGFDFEFRHGRPGVWVKKHCGEDRYWHDPRSVVPLLLAVALVEIDSEGGRRSYRFVVNCRRPEATAPLADLLRLQVPFVAHFAQVELFCLWQLGLPAPDQLWDTWVAERAFLLGMHHARYVKERPVDESEEARAKEAAEEQVAAACGLLAACGRRGVRHPFAADKGRLQKSFLDHPEGQAFSAEQLEYAAADAEAAARLYPAQAQVAVERGCLTHLTTVEMPWAVTNAAMVWAGVRVDPERCAKLLGACRRHQERIGRELQGLGVANPNSHPQLEQFFRAAGLLDAFRVPGGYSFDDDHLEAVEARHPAVAKVRAARKIGRMLSDKTFTGELVGADDRLHPEHRQLGAESGRNAMRWPNVGGIGRALRPLVVPEEGHLVGEVDLSQIEIGIAAAVYGDPELVRMFNTGDVYSMMVRSYYAAELPAGARDLPDKKFKKQYARLRDRMKVFSLATIYNITPYGLALRLGITSEEAAREQTRFLSLFPALDRALRVAADYGVLRGYVPLVSGLRRWRGRGGAPTGWEVNWMRNVAVQGAAAVAFKLAGNRLWRRYQHHGARMILPMHDAIVFETPRASLGQVAKITAEVLRGAVQEYFPVLDPQVEINIGHPDCWNKDGKWRSLALWMIDPELAR